MAPGMHILNGTANVEMFNNLKTESLQENIVNLPHPNGFDVYKFFYAIM